MPLGSPAVIGPVSTATTSVIVVGQLEGAALTVLQGTKVVGNLDHARGGSAQVSIDHALLTEGSRLVATQRVGSDTSPPSPRGVLVEKALLGPLTAPYTIYACAESYLVTNCCPGAIVEVKQENFIVGSATAVGDVARVYPNVPGVLQNKAITLSQRVPPSGVSYDTKLDRPTPSPGSLPKPVFDQPVQRCQIEVQISSITPGAHVTVKRGGSTIFDQSVPDALMQLHLSELREGETLTVVQTLPRCKLTSPEASVTVAPLASLPPPFVDGQLCSGARRLKFSRLQPGAVVTLFANGQELGHYLTAGRELTVDVTLPTNAKITAQQSLCGMSSPLSREYPIGNGAGRWFLVEDAAGDNLHATAFAIHAALMHTGKIVMFSGDQHWNPLETPHQFGPCQLFDCKTFTIEVVDKPMTDVFCCGHAIMPDGRLLVAGGTEGWQVPAGPAVHADHFPGLPWTWIFDPIADSEGNHWKRLPQMKYGGRWYPTLLTLLDGRVLALGGHPEGTSADHYNQGMEVSDGREWTRLGLSNQLKNSDVPQHLYPRLMIGPSGTVFSVTPISGKSAIWDPQSGGTTWTLAAPPPPSGWRPDDDWYDDLGWPSAVMPLFEVEEEPSSFRFFVILAGPKVPWIIDLGTPAHPNPSPEWKTLGSNHPRRIHSNLVSLADSNVILVGGMGDRGHDNTAVKDYEFLGGSNEGWGWGSGPRPKMSIPRGYHTTALLMPDGRVFVAGSNINASPGPPTTRHEEVEIFAPWYCCADRPRIISAPQVVDSGGSATRVEVHVRGDNITRFTLVRAGSFTHSFNPDERNISLISHRIDEGHYWFKVPARPVPVPGWYMLFAVTYDHVPSEAVWVRIA